jgi:hypothetical protein
MFRTVDKDNDRNLVVSFGHDQAPYQLGTVAFERCIGHVKRNAATHISPEMDLAFGAIRKGDDFAVRAPGPPVGACP